MVILPAAIAADWQLVEGSEVEVCKAATSPAEVQYLSDEEARELFEKIEPLHRNTFTELAK